MRFAVHAGGAGVSPSLPRPSGLPCRPAAGSFRGVGPESVAGDTLERWQEGGEQRALCDAVAASFVGRAQPGGSRPCRLCPCLAP